jgi:hypothetical protein
LIWNKGTHEKLHKFENKHGEKEWFNLSFPSLDTIL